MSSNCCGAEKVFDLKTANKELKIYKKSGPSRATKALLASMEVESIQNKSLLDIGGGIGAIQWYFLEHGGVKVTDVDYSPDYIEVARRYSKENGWHDLVDYFQGDFLDVAGQISSHDWVTLDKVICCYPDYEGLLDLALERTNKKVGLVYPLGGPIAKFFSFVGRIYLKLSGNSFRPYIHPVSNIRKQINSNGFQRVSNKISFPWRVEIYQRIPR